MPRAAVRFATAALDARTRARARARAAGRCGRCRGRLRLWNASAALFLNAARTGPRHAVGETVRNPDLARTLELLAAAGPDALYRGALAREIIAAAAAAVSPRTGRGGQLTEDDLARYRAVRRTPVRPRRRRHRVVGRTPEQARRTAGSAGPARHGCARPPG